MFERKVRACLRAAAARMRHGRPCLPKQPPNWSVTRRVALRLDVVDCNFVRCPPTSSTTLVPLSATITWRFPLHVGTWIFSNHTIQEIFGHFGEAGFKCRMIRVIRLCWVLDAEETEHFSGGLLETWRLRRRTTLLSGASNTSVIFLIFFFTVVVIAGNSGCYIAVSGI